MCDSLDLGKYSKASTRVPVLLVGDGPGADDTASIPTTICVRKARPDKRFSLTSTPGGTENFQSLDNVGDMERRSKTGENQGMITSHGSQSTPFTQK